MTNGMNNVGLFRPSITMQNSDVGNHPNEKNSSEEYFARQKKEEEQEDFKQSEFVDKSAQLNATLTSLASLNAASIIRIKKQI
ncbi:MAG: hypothetical protein WC197_03935 [Candidatus Gastranaerophilaceae bacterium]|jgi:hypothetical protein